MHQNDEKMLNLA